ncbi:MAG: hypothetical protein RL380_1806 [Verrucomicrobiota bacterium]
MPDSLPTHSPLAVDDLMSHAEVLYRYAITRVRDHHAAEDLVQDTLLAAVRKPENFSGQSKLSTWLTGILRNKILDHFRAAARKREDTLSALDAHAEHDPDGDWFDHNGAWASDPTAGLEVLEQHPRKLLENAEVMAAIRACLGKLPPSLRQLYALREFDGCATEQICEVTGVTRGSLAVLLHRARQLLRACLQKNFINP